MHTISIHMKSGETQFVEFENEADKADWTVAQHEASTRKFIEHMYKGRDDIEHVTFWRAVDAYVVDLAKWDVQPS